MKIDIEVALEDIWQQCPNCSGETVCDAIFVKSNESLLIQCDSCSTVHKVPFSNKDITKYIRESIYVFLEEDCDG